MKLKYENNEDRSERVCWSNLAADLEGWLMINELLQSVDLLSEKYEPQFFI